MPPGASQTIRLGRPGSEARNALQLVGWAVGKASGAPKLRPAGHIADRAEDVEGDPAGRDPPTGGVQRPDAERQVIEQERALSRPGARAMGLEDDRRKELNPVCDQLAAV
jgi:hypothetical protein